MENKTVKKILFIVLALLIIQLLVLYKLGIATLVYTITVYVLIFILINIFKLNRYFYKVIIIFFIIDLTFFLINNKRNYFIYLSTYKRVEQVDFFNSIGIKKAILPMRDAYKQSERTVVKKDFTEVHHYNSEGFRGTFPPIEKKKNEYRIIILGDSFIEGDGTSDDATIPALLQQKLNALNESIYFTVLNGGISGSNPIYEQALYYKKLAKYKPDLIVNTVYANDFEEVWRMQSNKLPLFEYFCSASFIIRIIFSGIFKYNNFSAEFMPKSEIKKFNTSRQIITDSISVFKNSLNKNNIDFLLLYIPSKDEVLFSNKYSFYNFLNQPLNYDVNIYKSNQLNNKVNKYYWKKDSHFNPKGYNLVSEILTHKILKDYARTY